MNFIFCAFFLSGIWFGLADEGTRCYPSAALIKKAEFLSLKEKTIENLMLDFSPFVKLIYQLDESINELKTKVPQFLKKFEARNDTLDDFKFVMDRQDKEYFVSTKKSKLFNVDRRCTVKNMKLFSPSRDNILIILKELKKQNKIKIPINLIAKNSNLYNKNGLLTTFNATKFQNSDFNIPGMIKLKDNTEDDFAIEKAANPNVEVDFLCERPKRNFAFQKDIEPLSSKMLKDFDTSVDELSSILMELKQIANESSSNLYVSGSSALKIYAPLTIILKVQNIYRLSNLNYLLHDSTYSLLSLPIDMKDLQKYFSKGLGENQYNMEISHPQDLKRIAQIPSNQYVLKQVKIETKSVTKQLNDFVVSVSMTIKTSFGAPYFSIFKIKSLGTDGFLLLEKFLVENNNTAFTYHENPLTTLKCYDNNKFCDTEPLENPSKSQSYCAKGILDIYPTYLSYCDKVKIFHPIANRVKCHMHDNLAIFNPNDSHTFETRCNENEISRFTIKKGLKYLNTNCKIFDVVDNKLLIDETEGPKFPPNIDTDEEDDNSTYFILSLSFGSVLTVVLTIGSTLIVYFKCCKNKCCSCCSKETFNEKSEDMPSFRSNYFQPRTVPTANVSRSGTLRRLREEFQDMELEQVNPLVNSSAPNSDLNSFQQDRQN